MASWKLGTALFICVVIVLVSQANGQRGRGGWRRRQRQQNQGTSDTGEVSTTEQIRNVTLVLEGNDGEVETTQSEVSVGPVGQGRRRAGNAWRRRGGAARRAGRRGGRRRGGRERHRGRQQTGARGGTRRRWQGRRGRGGQGGRNRQGRRRQNPTAHRADSGLLMRGLSSSMGAFGWNLYKELADANTDNFVFSPLSIHTALGMLVMGTQGATKQEIITSLHVTSPIHPAFSLYNSALAQLAANHSTVLSIANAIYHKRGFTTVPRYRRKLRMFYNAEISEFTAVSPELAVNAWVENKTRGEIEDFLAENSIDPNTLVMLINVVYYKGNWTFPFDAELTRLKPFKVGDSETILVDTMSREGLYSTRHFPDLHASVVELPYNGDRFSLFILLPDEASSLSSLEDALTSQILNDTLNADLDSGRIVLELPKFSLDAEQDMVEILRNLGIQSVFDPQTCRLTRMIRSRGAAVSQVQHRAVMEVDETGTVAAAATSISFIESAFFGSPPAFKVNRPFLFVLRDKETQLNLFMGRYVTPQGDNLAD